MKADYAEGKKKRIHRLVAGKWRKPLQFLSAEDGTVTAEPDAVCDLARNAMTELYQKYLDSSPVAWEDFRDEYSEEIRMLAWQDTRQPVTGVMLRVAHCTRRLDARGGGDAWRTHEARHWPVEIWDEWAGIFVAAERGALWPRILQTLLGCMIDKGEGPSPSKQRLIRLIAVVHAAYSKARFTASVGWQKRVLPKEVCGGRRHLGTQDLTLPTVLDFEIAKRKGNHWNALSVDKRKCFDLFLAHVMCPLYVELGGRPWSCDCQL